MSAEKTYFDYESEINRIEQCIKNDEIYTISSKLDENVNSLADFNNEEIFSTEIAQNECETLAAEFEAMFAYKLESVQSNWVDFDEYDKKVKYNFRVSYCLKGGI